MAHFTKDYIDFFKDLSKNNNTEWFHSQKKRYEESVKKPFAKFVTELITEIKKRDKSIELLAKDCVSRINRDIRFSADKTPYNLHLNAFLGPGGRKDKSLPGLAVRLSPEMVGIMGGSYGTDKDQLMAFRNTIQKDSGVSFGKIIKASKFQSMFGEVRGEKMKRIPKEFQEVAEKAPIILNKQLYIMGQEKPDIITSDDLINVIMGYYETMTPFNEYLKEAMISE